MGSLRADVGTPNKNKTAKPLAYSCFKTRSQAQKPAHKNLPKPSHLGLRPLMLRFLTGPVHALPVCLLSTFGLWRKIGWLRFF
ncbi:hypothetical protein EFP50_13200 [Lacticaseibacillus paracasei]|nr:hypothetical protein [Lacticaseibacillus paracasei]